MNKLEFKNEPIFTLHYDFLRFIVFLDILFYKEEFLWSEEYKIGEYIEGTNKEFFLKLVELIEKNQKKYYENLEEVNNFVGKFQNKYLDVEELILDINLSAYKKINSDFKNSVISSQVLKDIYYDGHLFFVEFLSLEQEDLRLLIKHLNSTLDFPIFNIFIDMLKTYFKEIYPNAVKQLPKPVIPKIDFPSFDFSNIHTSDFKIDLGNDEDDEDYERGYSESDDENFPSYSDHNENCCFIHGCYFNDDLNCPVLNGIKSGIICSRCERDMLQDEY